MEPLTLSAGAVVAILIAWVWAMGELAGWTATGRWPHIGASELPWIIGRLPHDLGNPRRAWPLPVRRSLPTAGVFYGWAVAGMPVLVVAAIIARRCSRGRHGGGARWARASDLGQLLVRAPGRPGRMIVGRTGPAGRRPGRRLVATERGHSLLVIGPTQSGKTTGLAIPALLEWKGPVVATSVKDDLAGSTIGWRSAQGPCAVFDPTQSSGTGPLSRWSPVALCTNWTEAQRIAGWLVESTPGRRGMADAAFWYSAAAKQLAPLMLAAERAGGGLAEVVRWTDSTDFDEPLRLLELSADTDAALALSACAGRDDRIRSSVATTLETVLAPFADPVVAASTSGSDIDVASLLRQRGTLYLCGPSQEQNRVQGLFSALVSTVVAEAFRVVAQTGKPLDPPLLLVLDEAANIAPIRDLDTLASTGAGVGIQLVTVCQDLAQLSARYDPERARTIANNHRAKLLLSGVADLGTLDLVSGLAGEQSVREVTSTQDLRDGRRTRSTATVMRRLAPTDELRRTLPGQGVLIYGHLPPVRLQLRPWYRDRDLRRRVAASMSAGRGSSR